jgi:phosphoglycerate kinase
MNNIPSIQSAGNLKGKRVIVRVDFNVPIKDGRIGDDYRLKKTLQTILFLKKKGAKTILISHIGKDEKSTLKPVADYFNRKQNIKMGFIPDWENPMLVDITHNMQNGSVILLENLRRNPGEKTNDLKFAKKMASLADIYVNDAFSASHRKHASIVGITKYLPSYAGFLLVSEEKNLRLVLEPKHPFLFILGGAKISTKMPLLQKFAKTADSVFVGGALANDLLKARGVEIGISLVDPEVKNIKKIASDKKILLPIDVLVKNEKGGEVRALEAVGKEDFICDVGPKTRASFDALVSKHKFIVFNGTLGEYEAGYDKGTKKLLKVLADSKAKVILGGGDTVIMVEKMKLGDAFHFVSTGGGAMLDYLTSGSLPGIDALKKVIK